MNSMYNLLPQCHIGRLRIKQILLDIGKILILHRKKFPNLKRDIDYTETSEQGEPPIESKA
jgi:hypothetical protein